MDIISNTVHCNLQKSSAVAFGKFDGVHIGHRALLEKILEQKKKGLTPVVFTFDPSPVVFFGKGEEKELTDREEKRKIFASLGIETLVEFPLNPETAAISPERFVREILGKEMKSAYLCCGSDVSFGKGGAGNAALLQQLGSECGFTLEILKKIMYGEREVSSSLVRDLVREGKMEEAGRLLSQPYSIFGEVGHGRQLGRTMGFPTLNQTIGAQKLLPPNGVYFTRVWVEEKGYDAVTNIGCKPTVSSKMQIGAESHLLDFSGDLYGRVIRTELLHFHRPEKKFDSVEKLYEQIAADQRDGKTYFTESGKR